MTRDVTDSEAKAPIIVPLSRKVGIRATTPIAQSWRSVLFTLYIHRDLFIYYLLFIISYIIRYIIRYIISYIISYI